MLEGWYCRTLANEQAATGQQDDDDNDPNVVDSGSDDSHEQTPNSNTMNRSVDYKAQYKYLKQKLKFLVYENEFFQDALRTSQRRLLKVSRDRSFLLDRLLQYEKPEGSSSESDETESSDESSKVETKKRKYDSTQSNKNATTNVKKKKTTQQKQKNQQNANQATINQSHSQSQHQHQQQHHHSHHIQEGHMTAEEVERHLQSRQSISELLPERAPPTVPTEMFSNEPSLDSESNDQMIETSPSNIGEDCVSVDMNIKTEYIKTEY